LRAYFERLIERRRTDPGEDVITALVRAEEERDILSGAEILALAVLLLLAGNETTTNLIGNAVRNLLSHPAELAKVRADRALVPSLVEEVLRYDSPVQLLPRVTAREVELEGGKIPAGAIVFLLLASANRDERKFPDPDRFDVTRNPQDHVAFGYGITVPGRAKASGRRIALGRYCLIVRHSLVRGEHLPQIASLIVRGVQTLPLRFAAWRAYELPLNVAGGLTWICIPKTASAALHTAHPVK
jgi:cytochrome P450